VKVICDNCGKEYNVPEEKVPPTGVRVTCKKCSTVFMVRRPSTDEGDILQEIESTAIEAKPATSPEIQPSSSPVQSLRADGASLQAVSVKPAGVGMPCFVHTSVQAVAVCSRCGNPVCPQCQNKMLGRNFCDTCAKLEMAAVGTNLGQVQRQQAPTVIQIVQQMPPVPVEEPRNRLLAMCLAMFLGPLGLHEFYLGRPRAGCTFLCLSILSKGVFVPFLFLFTWTQAFVYLICGVGKK
jgi:predicted Zn finger-like uncharacterized protein